MTQFPNSDIGEAADFIRKTAGCDSEALRDGQTLAKMLQDQPRERIQAIFQEAFRTDKGLIELAHAHQIWRMTNTTFKAESEE